MSKPTIESLAQQLTEMSATVTVLAERVGVLEAQVASAPKTQYVSTPRAESNEARASRLLKEGKDPDSIEKEFVDAYAKKGITDITYIRGRVAIYMQIAKKRVPQVIPAPAPPAAEENTPAPEVVTETVAVTE